MGNEGRDSGERDGGQPGRQQARLPAGWQFLAVVVLGLAFAIIADLLAVALGVAGSTNVAIAGFILAALLIPMTAPRSLTQLGLIMAVVAAGGTLAILTFLATGLHVPGLWGIVLGITLAASPGGGFIVLAYRFLRVPYRRPPPEDRA